MFRSITVFVVREVGWVLKIFVGLLVGGYSVFAIGNAWVVLFLSFALGGVSQVLYARSLNAFLGGEDPVQLFGVRNLYELHKVISLPAVVFVFDFLAKMFFMAGGVGILFVLGLLQIGRG